MATAGPCHPWQIRFICSEAYSVCSKVSPYATGDSLSHGTKTAWQESAVSEGLRLAGFKAAFADSFCESGSRAVRIELKEDIMRHQMLDKGYKGMGMEGLTAKWYAALTFKALDDFKRLARRVAAQVPEGGSVLEVAPGPGYFAIELAKLGRYRITGLDISRTFVEIAHRNARQAGLDIN